MLGSQKLGALGPVPLSGSWMTANNTLLSHARIWSLLVRRYVTNRENWDPRTPPSVIQGHPIQCDTWSGIYDFLLVIHISYRLQYIGVFGWKVPDGLKKLDHGPRRCKKLECVHSFRQYHNVTVGLTDRNPVSISHVTVLMRDNNCVKIAKKQ